MYEYWVVIEYRTGKVIAHCGNQLDAIMLCELYPKERVYKKQRFIQDQVIDVTSTTDKQLPGQLGLPAAVEELPMQQQVWLPEGLSEPVKI